MNWQSIRYRKPSAIAAAVPTVIAFAVAMTFIVTLGVFLMGTGWAWAAMRRKSRLKRSLTNLKLADSYVDLDFPHPAGRPETSVRPAVRSLSYREP